jgi:hypothetical protein
VDEDEGVMTAAYEELIALADVPVGDRPSRSQLEPLWLRAANERLAQQRARIPVLGRLADEVGITEIATFDDLVPLLFAHSNYKSYPEAFIAKGRWELMNRWLDTLSSVRVDNVDVAEVSNQDDWVERLHAAEHMVYVTSGTSGKNSFLPATPFDERFSLHVLVSGVAARPAFAGGQRRAIFILGPKYGAHRAAQHFRTLAEEFGRPGACYFLTEEPMRVSEISRMAELRRKIAAGTAMPSEIASFERETKARQEDMATRLDGLIDKLIEHRREPMFIGGFWAQYWLIVERARERGVAAGEFHPDTIITGGGGTKGAAMPDDYQEQILAFFGIPIANVQSGYGMSELSSACTEIDGRYRPPPWVIPLVLDDRGEKLVHQPEGFVDGRFAFFDTALEGRWGGVITGDHVTADFSARDISVVPGSIERYSVLEGGDDKLTCAGTIDAYVRGVME